MPVTSKPFFFTPKQLTSGFSEIRTHTKQRVTINSSKTLRNLKRNQKPKNQVSVGYILVILFINIHLFVKPINKSVQIYKYYQVTIPDQMT